MNVPLSFFERGGPKKSAMERHLNTLERKMMVASNAPSQPLFRIIYSERFLDHDTGLGHPENSGRLTAVVTA